MAVTGCPVTIYLSGPMSGLPEFNYPAFAKYAARYRAEGMTVMSPHEMDGGDTTKPWAFYLRNDITLLASGTIERIYLMPGWHQSRGANLEKTVGEALGIALYDAETGEPFVESAACEAHRLVHGTRGADYGHPAEDFRRTGRMWAALLGVESITAQQVGLCMIALKLSRECHRPKRDNRVDIAGYAETLEMIQAAEVVWGK